MMVYILSYAVVGIVSSIVISWVLYAIYRIFWGISIKELFIGIILFSFFTFIGIILFSFFTFVGYIIKGIIT